MAKEVILMPLAKEDINNIVEYLIADWDINTANSFLDRLEKMFNLISESPQIYPVINKSKALQRCIVTKQNVLYFIETKDHIKVITIFDTRQNPERLNKIL